MRILFLQIRGGYLASGKAVFISRSRLGFLPCAVLK